MSVEQQVDALATSVDELTGAVVTKRATLDASVVDAQSATAQAQDAKTSALSARDQAGAFKDAAYTAAQSAASAVAYQDLTALAESKDVTAVDLVIYDTAKDSDGGAWRHRCAGTSWYREPLNTATRGGRRGFPAVAVIVAEADKLTIYDGDDPGLPMWMVFEGGSSDNNRNFLSGLAPRNALTCVAAKNGFVLASGNTGSAYRGHLRIAEFVADRMSARIGFYNQYFISPLGLGERNNPSAGFPITNTTSSFGPGIVSGAVNDVAMTVLPDAPLDTATGLPTPTIAVATDGGVSVIKDDGAVVDSADTGLHQYVGFNENGELVGQSDTVADDIHVYTDYSSDGFGFTRGIIWGQATHPLGYANRNVSLSPGKIHAATDLVRIGLQTLLEQPRSPAKGMVNFTTSTYNTGWMPGDIKGAFLSDTDGTDLVGGTVYSDEFVDASGWVLSSGFSIEGGAFILGSGFGNGQSAYKDIGLVQGKTYALEFDYTQTSSASIRIDDYGAIKGGSGVKVIFITKNSSDGRIGFSGHNAYAGEIRNLRVSLADPDRSVNNNGLIVNGTVTRTPVAAGADLVAYSGFSASNYLEQPYNPDLDFGTGDFCMMGWVLNAKVSGPSSAAARKGEGVNDGRFLPRHNPDGTITFYVSSSSAKQALGPYPTSGDFLIAYVRESGALKVYLNGVLTDSMAAPETIVSTNQDDVLYLGTGIPGSCDTLGDLALWRISTTAPTPEQIKRIYEDERPLFQENAACTLNGASSAVTALAHDPDTGLLGVTCFAM